MKIIISVICIFLCLMPVLGRNNTGSIESLIKINELSSKQEAEIQDSIFLFVLELEKKPADFKGNMTIVTNHGVLKQGIEPNSTEKLTRGFLASMIARYKKLDDHLLYRIFESERYAFRACVAHGIMEYNGSENEIVSGEELIEIMSKISTTKRENTQ